MFCFKYKRKNSNHVLQVVDMLGKNWPLSFVGAFSGRIGLPPAVMGWAASRDDGP